MSWVKRLKRVLNIDITLCQDLDTLAIAQFNDGQALLWDVFGPKAVDLDYEIVLMYFGLYFYP